MTNPEDVQALRGRLEAEIDSYLSNYAPRSGLIGRQWSVERIEAELAYFRACLIDPFWIDVSIHDPERHGREPTRHWPCVAVAEEPGAYLLVFMPHRDEFLLLQRSQGGWVNIGVDGDPVGVFLAR